MSASIETLDDATRWMNKEYLLHFPAKAARYIETQPVKDAALLLQEHSPSVLAALWSYLPPGSADELLMALPQSLVTGLLKEIPLQQAAAVLTRLDDADSKTILADLKEELADELRELISFPADSAARLMQKHLFAFEQSAQASRVLSSLKQRNISVQDAIYVLDDEQRLVGELDLAVLLKAHPDVRLSKIVRPVKSVIQLFDSKQTVIDQFESTRSLALPIVDAQHHLAGSIRLADIYQSTKEELVSDIQTMVGASKDERALSTSWFAVRRRMPWLQINLLTAFAAAAVVGAFEGLIAEITALAILLPVAAGQSGNAGAQALAVTMRGLTLREITVHHWPRVFMKEMAIGALNGLAIALTCSIGVYVWSQSIGLALVIALAMVVSLTIACCAGAVVPILLKRFGLDPAQSSSIVLTTVTDIAGFLSFLGIALLLADYLPR